MQWRAGEATNLFYLFFGGQRRGKGKGLTQHHHRGVHHGCAGVVVLLLLLRLVLLVPVGCGGRDRRMRGAKRGTDEERSTRNDEAVVGACPSPKTKMGERATPATDTT
jgi:hypothetical protein